MIYITNQARQELSRLYTEQEHSPEDCLRLTDRGNDAVDLTLEARHDGDESLELTPQMVLLVEPAVMAQYAGVSVDAYDTPDGPRLIISRERVLKAHASVTVNWVRLAGPACSRN